MLAVQQYLHSGKTFEDLSQELGIRIKRHESLPLVILNYDQIESPKTHEIVRECRALVLHRETFEIVARAFNRFFNWEEDKTAAEKFSFENCIARAKEDGSLVLLYYFDGSWRVNTCGSFAQDLILGQSFTWEELFCEAINITSLDKLNDRLDPHYTYVFELTSLYNKIVREYKKPRAFLLSCFHGEAEISDETVTTIAQEAGFERPQKYDFRNIDEVKTLLERMESEDPTFEGFVLRDKHDVRMKIKNKRYLTLHHMRGNGEGLYAPKHLLPWALADEGDELLAYFPEAKRAYEAVKQKVFAEYDNLEALWGAARHIMGQKDFAIAVVPHTKFSGLLFTLRKGKGHSGTKEDLQKAWRNSEELILKVLFK